MSIENKAGMVEVRFYLKVSKECRGETDLSAPAGVSIRPVPPSGTAGLPDDRFILVPQCSLPSVNISVFHPRKSVAKNN